MKNITDKNGKTLRKSVFVRKNREHFHIGTVKKTNPDGSISIVPMHNKERIWIECSEEGQKQLDQMCWSGRYDDVYVSEGYFWNDNRQSARTSGVACFTTIWVDLDIGENLPNCEDVPKTKKKKTSLNRYLPNGRSSSQGSLFDNEKESREEDNVPGWNEMNILEQSAFLKNYCMEKDLPVPTEVIFSGRGFHLKWHLTEPLWNVGRRGKCKPGTKLVAINNEIVRRLKRIGADEKATDMARVLRVSGSKNSKTGNRCLVVDEKNPGPSYTFEQMSELLPWTSSEVAEFKKEKRKNRKSLKTGSKAKVIDLIAEREKREGTFSYRRHAQRIISDLETLAQYRWRGKVAKGHRDMFVHIVVSCVASYSTSKNLLSETSRYLSFIDDSYLEKEYEQEHSSAVAKLRSYEKRVADGEDFQNHQFERRWVYTIEKIIEKLGITSEEQEHMIALRSKELKQQDQKENKRKTRRAMGMRNNEYSDAKLKPWIALGMGKTKYYKMKKEGQLPEEQIQEMTGTNDVPVVVEPIPENNSENISGRVIRFYRYNRAEEMAKNGLTYEQQVRDIFRSD